MRKSLIFFALLTVVLASCSKLESNEKKYLEGMQSDNYETASQAYTDFCRWLEQDRETMTYDFNRMREQMGLKVATSADGHLRCYSWNTTPNDTLHIYANVSQWLAGENFIAFTGPIDKILSSREKPMAHMIDSIYSLKLGNMNIYLIAQSYINKYGRRRAYVSACTIQDIRLAALPFFFDGTDSAGNSEFNDDGSTPVDKLFKWDEKTGIFSAFMTDDNYNLIPGQYVQYKLGSDRFTRLTTD